MSRINTLLFVAATSLCLPLVADTGAHADGPGPQANPTQQQAAPQGPTARRGPGGPGFGRPGGPGASGGPEQVQTEEQLDDLMVVLKDADPDFYSKVERARKESPRAVRDLLATQGPRLFAMAQLKKNDPELYDLKIDDFKLNRRVDALSHEYTRTVKDGKPDGQKVAELKELLQKQFDLRQKIREKELERMEKKVSDLREQIQRRKSNKDQMLADRLKELTERPVDKDW
jgi:mRNA-degrading endonuclease YafQ of YafQ-DinJ toxin-antitoxin module